MCSSCSLFLPSSFLLQGDRRPPRAQQAPPAAPRLHPPSHRAERRHQHDGRPQPGGVHRPHAAAAERHPAG